jgi:hypothetical protein
MRPLSAHLLASLAVTGLPTGLADATPMTRSPGVSAAADPGTVGTATMATRIEAAIAEASLRFGLPPDLIRAVITVESAHRPHAVSRAGAMGLMQLMPGTWQAERSALGLGEDVFDPRDNVLAGTSYLAALIARYGAEGGLAAYNAGPARYERFRDDARPLPAETVAYVTRLRPTLAALGWVGSAGVVIPAPPASIPPAQTSTSPAPERGTAVAPPASATRPTSVPIEFSPPPPPDTWLYAPLFPQRSGQGISPELDPGRTREAAPSAGLSPSRQSP